VKASVFLFVAACSSAVSEPSPVAVYAPGHAQGRNASQLLQEANMAWDKRALPGKAETAQGLFLDAAVVDGHDTAGLIGAMKALSFRIEYEKGVDKEKLSGEEVQLGQWCQRRAPQEAECDYRLAIALGQQARERTSTGRDAMNRMVDLLKAAAKKNPALDDGGPHRVLAIVLARAPGWPVGPGDNEAALAEARKAVAIAPNNTANQLVLGETLAKNDAEGEALAAYKKAAELALKGGTQDPEVARQLADAKSGIEKTGG
jgi:tetratricopeptide (TPR) repeat protein